MYDLLDCVSIDPGEWIFAVVHRDTNEFSVMVPCGEDDFSYLGLDDWRVLSEVGSTIIVTDEEGNESCITRIN